LNADVADAIAVYIFSLREVLAMPVYEFVCRDCQKPFEIARPISEAHSTDVKCPGCGSGRVDRIYSQVYAKTSKKS
jgi:putative FmdB family regulatory protein